MTQDERLPGAEAILSECAGFFHPYCGKVSMTVDFSISLKFLGPENFICTHMTIPFYPSSVVEDFTGNGLFPAFSFLYKLFSQVYPTIISNPPYATLRAPPWFFLNMNYPSSSKKFNENCVLKCINIISQIIFRYMRNHNTKQNKRDHIVHLFFLFLIMYRF